MSGLGALLRLPQPRARAAWVLASHGCRERALSRHRLVAQTSSSSSSSSSSSLYTQTPFLYRKGAPARTLSSAASADGDASSGGRSGGGGGGGGGMPNPEVVRRAKLYSVMMGSACAFFSGCYILYYQLKMRADDGAVVEVPSPLEPEASDQVPEGEEGEEEQKKRVSFHDRRVIGYEDRIRAYSTPDKIFRYFATLKIRTKGASYIYMTPDDFLRSITPGIIQPDDLGLDQFRTITVERWIEERSAMNLDPNSVFSQLGHHGLISFSNYLFLLTMLSAPMRNFTIAFKMFDLNGDGDVDFKEFDQVREVIMNSTAIGERHRDHLVTGSVAGSVDDALVEHFFGHDMSGKLTVEKFRQFHRKLRLEILKLEFEHYDPVDGRISERNFAKLVLSSASMNDQRKKKYIKRVKKVYGPVFCPESEVHRGITFDDVCNFAEFLDDISDVEIALSMYLAAGSSINVDDLKKVSNAVTGVALSDHLVEVIFTLFDENGDDELSYKEFIKVMKSRTTRGLDKSKELGFAKVMSAMWGCAGKTAKSQLGITT